MDKTQATNPAAEAGHHQTQQQQKRLLSMAEVKARYEQGKRLLAKRKERIARNRCMKPPARFEKLGLIAPLLKAVEEKGWQVCV